MWSTVGCAHKVGCFILRERDKEGNCFSRSPSTYAVRVISVVVFGD